MRHDRQFAPTGCLTLLAFLALCFLAAGVGGMFTAESVKGWYQRIEKPSWNPPDQVFGPVWTVLYALMAVSAWLVWQRAGGLPAAGPAMAWFAVQLALNVLWSALFFGLQQPGLAFIELLLLWLAIAGTMVAFHAVLPLAAWLLLPYLLWVTFAGTLNYAIWRLNA